MEEEKKREERGENYPVTPFENPKFF